MTNAWGTGIDFINDSQPPDITEEARKVFQDEIALATEQAGIATAAATQAQEAADSISDVTVIHDHIIQLDTEIEQHLADTVAAKQAAQQAVIDAENAVASVDTANLVHISGDEDITGIKNYTVSPLVPDLDVTDVSGKSVNSKFVDESIKTKGGSVSVGNMPTDLRKGMKWIDDTSGIEYTYVIDEGETVGQWVAFGSGIDFSNFARRTGDETIAGVKTYTSGISVTSINGGQLAGFRNKLINPSFSINQRVFNGNWGALSDGAYGYDRWKKSGANIVQVIEAGNYTPNTVHTLSGINVTTQQITSPASGHWSISVPNNAYNIQLEEGTVATPFEYRFIGFELFLCKRYFEKSYPPNTAPGTLTFAGAIGQRQVSSNLVYSIVFKVDKRTVPTMTYYNPVVTANGTWRDTNANTNITVTVGGSTSGADECQATITATGTNGNLIIGHWTADAEL